MGKVREDLKKLAPSLRGSWKLSGTFLTKATGRKNIRPLKCAGYECVKSATTVFRGKSVLPDGEVNQYTPLFEFSGKQMPGFLRLRIRTMKKLLKALAEGSSTGPDLLRARVLKRCADPLALPITLLTRKLLREGRWPACWRDH